LTSCIVGFTGCEKTRSIDADVLISDVKLIEKEIDIMNTFSVPEFIIGRDFNRNEIYVKNNFKSRERIFIQMIDIETGILKKEFTVKRGDFQSPTDFYSPSYMEFLDGKYYVVDQMEKIVVFDENFNHLYSNMFHKFRYFVNFFQSYDRIFLAIGTRLPEISLIRSQIELYGIENNRKPGFKKSLYEVDIKIKPGSDSKKRHHFSGVLWASTDGFVKNGNFFYTSMNQNRFYIYGLKTEKITAVELSYLTPKTFSREDAARFGFYKSDGWEEKFLKTNKKKIVYIPYPDPVYHFGIHDVGEDKIGIVGDIDLEQMKFRLDIIDSNLFTYLESIWFPIGIGFKTKVSFSNRGFTNNYFDVDKGIYIWQDVEGENFEYVVKISKFKLKTKK
jgi:hypothetical protein